MPRTRGQIRHCLFCTNKVTEYIYNGRFKGYNKTCSIHNGYSQRKGELNPSWKGGKVLSKDGYILVLHPERYNKKGISRYILEHRLVVETKLGRKLQRTEIVHHLNGIRNDNRFENLALIKGPTGHETWTLPNLLKRRILELEEELNAKSKN